MLKFDQPEQNAMRMSVRIALATLGCLAAACSEKRITYDVPIPSGVYATRVTIDGKEVPIDVVHERALIVLDRELKNPKAEITFQSPCGVETIESKPGFERQTETYRQFGFARMKTTKLIFADELVGQKLDAPPFTIPSFKSSPVPKPLEIAFGTCPRTLKIGSRVIEIPQASIGDAVVYVARDAKSCHVYGEALYGELQGDCRPESSQTLQGQDAYELLLPIHSWFESLDATALSSGKCTNQRFLDYCKSD